MGESTASSVSHEGLAAGRSRTGKPSLRRARGVTLIEVLVTILIIGIGLLGLAGMQTVSMQYNHSSYQRTHANNMAYDIGDRMRANRQAARNGDYDIALDGTAPTGGSIAANDLAAWRAAISSKLPDGTGSVAVNGDGVATIQVRWLDSRDEREADDVTTFTLETRI
jgi:type IV pilus assembly protein PilV